MTDPVLVAKVNGRPVARVIVAPARGVKPTAATRVREIVEDALREHGLIGADVVQLHLVRDELTEETR